MGGQDYTIPPLTLGQLRRLLPKVKELLDNFGTGLRNMTEAGIDGAIEVFHAALSRNYPELTPLMVAELVDMENTAPVLIAILRGSGLEQTSGEAAPVARLNGAGSTDHLPPAADTASQPLTA